MLAVPKDSSSCWKTDYMHAEFGNKDGVKHWQYGIVKKACSSPTKQVPGCCGSCSDFAGPEATGGVKKKPGEGPKQAGMHLCQECLTREWGKGWVRGGDSFNSCLEPEPASGAGGASGQLLTSFNVDSNGEPIAFGLVIPFGELISAPSEQMRSTSI
ncbi:hypothetical protein CB1_001275002 [Camelus ferus]|nr:hypothetical protein CB1_001275002 [Camelus ferus]